jgi:hypothetical protein
VGEEKKKKAQLQYTNDFVKKEKKRCFISPWKNQPLRLINTILQKKKRKSDLPFCRLYNSHIEKPIITCLGTQRFCKKKKKKNIAHLVTL